MGRGCRARRAARELDTSPVFFSFGPRNSLKLDGLMSTVADPGFSGTAGYFNL